VVEMTKDSELQRRVEKLERLYKSHVKICGMTLVTLLIVGLGVLMLFCGIDSGLTQDTTGGLVISMFVGVTLYVTWWISFIKIYNL